MNEVFSRLGTFRKDENGAVTVDWVVLTAALVGLGIAVLVSVAGGARDLGNQVAYCQTQVGNLLARDWDHARTLRVIDRRCSR